MLVDQNVKQLKVKAKWGDSNKPTPSRINRTFTITNFWQAENLGEEEATRILQQ